MLFKNFKRLFWFRLKNRLRAPWFLKSMAWILAHYITFVYQTTRWTFLNEDIPQSYWDEKKPFVTVFWHNRVAMLVFSWCSKTPLYLMISGHSDGAIIADLVGFKGIKTICGSTSKGGAKAFREALRSLKKGETVGITPDGPRGPRFSVNPGAAQIARMAKVDILGVTYSLSHHKRLRSWDRLLFPLPFGRGIIAWSAAIRYDEKCTLEETCARIQQELIRISNDADKRCGHSSIPFPEKSSQ
ncbi:MAG: lysophospholipid acyltransferase family protein [Gammaproteobacteria bacterium]|nr:lysophospholipid acyltransferase family protein [Gammaproteobacteria bacterium]